MSCRKTKKNFSAFLDSALDSQTKQVIREHLASCPACFKEFSFQQKISAALQVKENKPAPAEFTQKVMAQIVAVQKLGSKALRSQISKGNKAFLKNRKVSYLRYGFAVAVLFFLVAGTSFGLSLKYPQYSLGPFKQIIAQNKEGVAPSIPKTGLGENKKPPTNISIATNNQPKAQNKEQPETKNKENKGSPSLNKSQPASNKASGKKEGNNDHPKVAVITPETKNKNASLPSKYEPRVFLNQPRVSESKLYQIKVDNVAQAQQKIQATAKTTGVNCSNLGQQQKEGKLMGLLQIKVPVNKTQEITPLLLAVGRVYDQQSEIKDLSAKFAEVLQRYQNLIAQRQNAAPDQAKELEAQIKELESQLTTWDKEAQYQVVTLWLEE
jgi:anti-sigma factor (TIGR02949 family)